MDMDYYKEKVNQKLSEFLNKKLAEDGKYDDFIKEMIENIIEFNLRGGKRIRPLACIFAYKCFSDSSDDDKIIEASIFIELMQAYLLIHDDIMDNSYLRRGKDTLHRIFSKIKNCNGMSMAILAGNLCASYAYESILKSSFDNKQKISALNYIGWINDRENYGQALDILPFSEISEEDIMKIYELKTATYTIQGPVFAGAVLAGASSEQINELKEYAYNIGIAFQIQDDINGVFGEVDKLGKPNDSDIKEGKKTLLIAKALELCSFDEKNFLLENYGNKNIDEKTIDKIRKIIKDSGAYDYCKNKLNELVKSGKNSLEKLELRDEGKNFLFELADYIRKLG